jgi:transposase
MLLLLEVLETQLLVLDSQVAEHLAGDPEMRRLQTAPQVGPLTSAAFVAALDTPHRFETAGQVVSYLGLAPKDDSTGERHTVGGITKAGSTRVRYLLVQAAWGILRRPESEDCPLHRWAERLEARRGSRIAVVGVARRLARILYAMWRDGRDYDASGAAKTTTSVAA